jgi:hypothetical protein
MPIPQNLTKSCCATQKYSYTVYSGGGTFIVNCNNNYTAIIDSVTLANNFGIWSNAKAKARTCVETIYCKDLDRVSFLFTTGCFPKSCLPAEVKMTIYSQGAPIQQHTFTTGGTQPCPAGDCDPVCS